MINVYNELPQFYYHNSRDFQLLGRICEMVLNYIKMNIDIIKTIPLTDNTNLDLIDLTLLTLGFEKLHSYSSVDLLKLGMSFKDFIKNKGTQKSIEACVNLLLRCQNIKEEAHYNIHTLKNVIRDRADDFNYLYTLDIYLPKETVDLDFLDDVFNYILPAGFTYNLYLSDYSLLADTITEIGTSDTFTQISGKVPKFNDNELRVGQVYKSNLTNSDPEYNEDLTYNGNSDFAMSVVVGSEALGTPSVEEENDNDED